MNHHLKPGQIWKSKWPNVSYMSMGPDEILIIAAKISKRKRESYEFLPLIDFVYLDTKGRVVERTTSQEDFWFNMQLVFEAQC